MRIDRSLLKSTSEVPVECQTLIDKLRTCSRQELLEILKKIDTWTFGKCELYHWIDILDICDSILESSASRSKDDGWTLFCDLQGNREEKELLLWVLHFTTLLIEHSFSRHLYNSMEHLITLLSSCDMNVVLGVLNLLYMFSKRSNFITRLSSDKCRALLSRLTYLAESWGGKDNGFGLADCCKHLPEGSYPASATTVHCEYYSDAPAAEGAQGPQRNGFVTCVHIPNVDKLPETPAKIMRDLLNVFAIPEEKHPQANETNRDATQNIASRVEQLIEFTRDGNASEVKLILASGANVSVVDNNGYSLLHYAVQHGHVAVCEHLLDMGADVNVTNVQGDTPLHKACNGHVDIVKLLIARGASVAKTDSNKSTPLHDASEQGYTAICEYLLDKGYGINVRSSWGVTPLHKACCKGHVEIIKLLIARGASVNITDIKSRTPLSYAQADHTSICEYLTEYVPH